MLRKLFTRSMLYFLTLASGKLLTAFFFIILARRLQPEKFGTISLFLTLVQVITVLADMGLKSWYQKCMARQKQQQLLSHLWWWRHLFYLLSVFGVVVASGFGFISWELCWPIIVALYLESLISIADAFYLARCQSLRLGYKLIVRNLLLFNCLAYIHVPSDYFHFFTFYNLTLLLVVLFYFPWRAISWRLPQRKNLPKPHGTLAYAAIDDLGILYSRLDQLVIEKLSGAASLGIYSAAYRFVDAFNLLPQALFHNLFPLAAKKNGISRAQVVKMVAIMATLGFIVGGGVWLLGPWIINLLLGESYFQSGQLLRAFGLVIVLFFTNAPLNTILQSSDFVRRYIPYLAATTALNLLLNLLLLPRLGLIGAVVAMLLAESTLLLINCTLVQKLYQQHS